MRAKRLVDGGPAIGGEAGDLALVPVDLVAERLGGETVGEAEAVDPRRFEQRLVAADHFDQPAAAQEAVAVLHVVAAAVGGIDQRIVPIGMKQRRERMRAVMVVEVHPAVVAKAHLPPQTGRVEYALGVGAPGAHQLALEADVAHPALQLLEAPAELAPGVEMGAPAPGKDGPAQRHGVHLRTGRAGDGQALVDRLVRDAAAVDLDAGQALERHRRDHPVVLEDGGATVVKARMYAEDEQAVRPGRHAGWKGIGCPPNSRASQCPPRGGATLKHFQFRRNRPAPPRVRMSRIRPRRPAGNPDPRYRLARPAGPLRRRRPRG